MSRPIKFRIWDPRIGCYRRRDEWAVSSNGQPLRYFAAGDGGYDVSGDEGLILEQSTGRFDRNGVEIYDGDIVKVEIEGVPGEFTPAGTRPVEWCYGMWSISDALMIRPNHFTIIGNIHEKKDLIAL